MAPDCRHWPPWRKAQRGRARCGGAGSGPLGGAQGAAPCKGIIWRDWGLELVARQGERGLEWRTGVGVGCIGKSCGRGCG